MLDLHAIVNNLKKYEQILQKRDPNIKLDPLIECYNEKKKYLTEFERLQSKRKEESRLLAKLDKKSHDFEEKRTELRLLSEEVAKLKRLIRETEQKLNEILLSLPNIILDEVPVSYNKEDKEIVKIGGTKPKFNFPIKSHQELCKSLGIIDFERSAKIAGTGFPLYCGKGAQLEWALINFMLTHSIKNGFIFILPPFLNNTTSLIVSGSLPRFKEEIYSCRDDDLHLIPTSEVPLTNLYRNETLDRNQLPIRLCAYSPCFRREAGSYGKLTRGLMRLHQFNKIEMYSICLPSESKKELKFLVENAENILKMLNLHYRIVNLPSCDLAYQSAQTYDIEVWLPYIGEYSEVSSASNCLDYQARRGNIRFRDGFTSGYVHTLNCSGLATPRVMIALLETYQTEDGHIIIPEVLRPYMGFDKI
jgi:seryl-tRNA synthetase